VRLDILLVKRGYFSSRQRAKECIKRGLVYVNGEKITKPSADVDVNAKIEVLGKDRPKGYWKLEEIDSKFNLFSGNEIVLDLGSSAGGFLLYASEKAKFVYGIEYSKDFEEYLKKIERKRRNVKVFIADAFKFDVKTLPEFDVILNDLTLPFTHSMTALRRYLPKLKKSGKVLFIHKIGDREEPKFEGFKILKVMDSKNKKERYYLLSLS